MYQLDDDSYLFPPVHEAMREPNGLLAIGGDLAPDRLKAAYYDGIFLGLTRAKCHYGGHPILERF